MDTKECYICYESLNNIKELKNVVINSIFIVFQNG